jgi:hypothetical protein
MSPDAKNLTADAMIRIITTVIVSGLLLSGCKPQQRASPPELGGSSGSVTWSASADAKKAVPGIDQASICYVGRAVVVWSAFDRGGYSYSSSNVHGAKGHGRVWSNDVGDVEFQFETKDGKSGAVKVNEAQYELADGNLFLVSAVGGEIQIKQLKRDMSDVKFERESLAAYAKNDAEIAAFFARME